jgi:hypothetical protein
VIKAYYQKSVFQDDKRKINMSNIIILCDESKAATKIIPIDTFDELLEQSNDWNYWNDGIYRDNKGWPKKRPVVCYDLNGTKYIDENNFLPAEIVITYKEATISMERLMEQPADLVIQYMKQRGMSADCLNYMRGDAN